MWSATYFFNAKDLEKHIYKSDVQATFEPNLHVIYSKWNIYYVLSYSVDLPGSFEIHWVGHKNWNCLQYQANFHSAQAWQTLLIFNAK